MENDSRQGLNNFKKKLVTEAWLEKFANTGSGWLIIISGSMSPLIQIKDQILIKKTTPSHIISETSSPSGRGIFWSHTV